MKKKDFFIILIVAILLVVAFVCIFLEYRENNQKEIKEETNNFEITEEGYMVIDTDENEEKIIYVSEVVLNSDDTYILKGNLGELYTITEDEYDYLKNQVPLVVDNINYYFTWSDEYNEYIFISEENDNVYYLQKLENDTYLVCLDAEDTRVYKESETKAQITLNKDIECKIGDDITSLSKWLENNDAKGKYTIKFEDDKCVRVSID